MIPSRVFYYHCHKGVSSWHWAAGLVPEIHVYRKLQQEYFHSNHTYWGHHRLWIYSQWIQASINYTVNFYHYV